jgi:hypothetical protein
MHVQVTLNPLQSSMELIFQVRYKLDQLELESSYINGSSELSEVVNGTRKDCSTLNVGACGTEDGKEVSFSSWAPIYIGFFAFIVSTRFCCEDSSLEVKLSEVNICVP